MFSLISGFRNWYFAKPTFKLLIIGEEKSGKSVWYSFNNRPTLSNSNTSTQVMPLPWTTFYLHPV